MELKVYKQDSTLRATISPEDNSTHQKGIMADNVLALSFKLYEFIPFEVNDYVDFLGERFTLLDRYRPQMTSTIEYQYDVSFYGIESVAKKALMLKMVDGDNDTTFALTDNARVHLQLVVDNINRIKGTNSWVIGEVLESDIKDILYDTVSCYDALNMIAEVFGTEWWIEGTTINLSRCEHSSPITLGYGQGLTALSKEANEKAPFFTRLYPIGSTRNIDPTNYGAPRLRLPGGKLYIERNAHLGIVEHAEKIAFEHIYPRRVGYVGKVRVERRTIEGVERDIYYFKDRDGLPFNPDEYEMPGLVKNMEFEGGDLNGQNFEVNFNSKTQEFEIINQYPYENLQLPGGSIIPRRGDPYVLWNIRMPQEYHALAEAELLEESNKVLDQFSVDTAIYKGSTDYIDLDERAVTLTLGQRVHLISPQYFDEGHRDSRITKFTRRVSEPNFADIECSYAVSPGRLDALEGEVTAIQAAFKEQRSKELHVLRSWDNADPTDYNVFSSIRSRVEHLSRRYPDTAKGFMQFLGGAAFGEFAGGPTGMGGRISATGHAELESLSLRRFLEVPELRYNRVEFMQGDKWRAPGGGLIDSVDRENMVITLKLEDGEIGAVKAGDICMGIWHDINPAFNATADIDDSKGNRTFAGFCTVYFAIEEVLDARGSKFRYRLRETSESYPRQYQPAEMMHFVGYGSFTDPARQTSVYETRTYQRYLREVSNWEFSVHNIAAQFGDLSNLAIHGLDMQGYSAYLNNIYMTGVIKQLDVNGNPLPEQFARWSSCVEQYHQYAIVSMAGYLFRALRDTSEPPVGLVKSGDSYLVSDGGYILRGPVDEHLSDDWEIFFRPAVDGKDGQYTATQFARGASLTDAPTEGWSDSPPAADGGKYMWMRTGVIVPPATEPAAWDRPVRVSGEDGPRGINGSWTSYVFKSAQTQPFTPTGTAPVPDGWLDEPNTQDGVWWMSKAMVNGATGLAGSWSVPVKMTGADGQDGDDGQYTVSQFALGTSLTAAPSTGWSSTPQTVSKGKYAWLRTGIVTPPATAPITWSAAIRISGEDGANGSWTSYVFKNSTIKPAKPTSTATIPSGWVDAPTGDGIWWMTKATIDGVTGKAGTWSAPVRLTGETGAAGIQGMIVRQSEWATGIEYHNDETLTTSPRFLDVVVTGSGTTLRIFTCKRSHKSSTSITTANTTYWQEVNNMFPVFTPLLLAQNAVIKFMQGQQLLIADTNGAVMGGFSAAGNYPLFMGNSDPSKAPLRYDKVSKQLTVEGIINATSGTFNGRVQVPFHHLGMIMGETTINLDEYFNISAEGYLTGGTLILPNDEKYNGASCNIFNTTMTGNAGPLYVKQKNGAPFFNAGTFGSEKSRIEIGIRQMAKFICIGNRWRLDNPSEIVLL